MKTSQALQEMVTKLAEKYDLDLSAPQAILGLVLGESSRLEIRKIDERLIGVIHYQKQGHDGDIVGDEIICFMSELGWFPLEKAQYRSVHTVYAEVTPDYNGVVSVGQRDQTELAELVDGWVREIEEHGFEQASKWESRRPKQTQPPSLDTLIAWMDQDGCEATDGCWVEHDGTCPHGCPSWLIELGLI